MSSIFLMKMFYIYGFYFSTKVKSYGLQLQSPNVKTFLVIFKNATVTFSSKRTCSKFSKNYFGEYHCFSWQASFWLVIWLVQCMHQIPCPKYSSKVQNIRKSIMCLDQSLLFSRAPSDRRIFCYFFAQLCPIFMFFGNYQNVEFNRDLLSLDHGYNWCQIFSLSLVVICKMD